MENVRKIVRGLFAKRSTTASADIGTSVTPPLEPTAAHVLRWLREVEILLVEDNATDAELCISMLRERNLANHLFWVKDGAEALDFLFARGSYAGRDRNAKPQMILLDLRLPRVDGVELLRVIRADPGLQSIPVVVVTSFNEEADVMSCYELGVSSYLQKPVGFDEFARVVANMGFQWVLAAA